MTERLRFVSLFAGIEAFGAGLEETGAYEIVGHVELEEYRRQVIAKRFPHSKCLGSDIRDVGAAELAEVGRIDGFCFGFPCKDLSLAGRGAGIVDGKHSSLFSEGLRLVKIAKPKLVLIENVRDLLTRGMEVVVRGLTEERFEVEWDCLPAAAFGAPHLRDRVWIVAHRAGGPCVFGKPTTLFPEPLRGAEAGRDFMKWPRAGWTESPDECLDLIPLAPLKRFRRGKAKTIWPHLDRDFIPTPVADDVKGGVIAHLRNKHGWDDAERSAITSLAVLARNDMEEATEQQLEEARASVPERLPTPRGSDAAKSRGDLTAVVKGRPNAHSGGVGRIPTPTEADSRGSRNWAGKSSKANAGTTLTDYAQQREGPPEETWSTPAGMGTDGHGNELSMEVRVREGVSDSERTRERLGDESPYPTPTAGDAERGTNSKHRRGNEPLGAAAARREQTQRFLTPNERDARKGKPGAGSRERGGRHSSLPVAAEMFPTPLAGDATGSRGSKGKDRPDEGGLRKAAAERERFPTPTAQDAKNDGGPSQHERNSLPLNTHVKVYPTPEASDGSGGRMSAEVGGTRPSGAKRAVTLATAAREAEREELWPTPKAEVSGPDFARSERERSGGDDLATAAAREDGGTPGQLNPDWVEWLMGLPIGHTNLAVENEDLIYWPWDSEPPGVPRLVQNMPNRVARVSALGDSLVKAAAFWLGAAALRALPPEQRPTMQSAAVAQSA